MALLKGAMVLCALYYKMDNSLIILNKLKKSPFRAKFHLNDADIDKVNEKGMSIIRKYASDLIDKRLALAFPVNDGKQTPFKGYPIFIAQHATATCCRGCLNKWHHITKGHELSIEEREYILDIIMAWIQEELDIRKIKTV